MKQQFVYHTMTRPEAGARRASGTAVAANTTEAVKEYLAYVALLSVGVALAIMMFALTAKVSVHWLDVISKPAFLADGTPATQPVPMLKSPVPVKFAMLPAPLPANAKN